MTMFGTPRLTKTFRYLRISAFYAVIVLTNSALAAPQATKPSPSSAPAKSDAAKKPPAATPPAKPVVKGTPPQSTGTPSTTGSQPDFNSLPTNITSDSLVLHSADRVFIYKGNVVVIQGDMTLTADQLEGTYDEQNQIQKLLASGDVKITKVDIIATGQRALYETATSTVTMMDTPQLTQKESFLTADKIKVFLNENRSQAEGNVRVTMIKPEGGSLGFPIGAKPTAGPTVATTPKYTTTTKPPARAIIVNTPKAKASPSPTL